MSLRLLAVAALVILSALPVRAQQVTLSTQVDYLLVDQRSRDPDQRTRTAGFLPRLNLLLTGRVVPGTRLYLDLSSGLTRDSFGAGHQATGSTYLVLRNDMPRYQLSLRHGRSSFSADAGSLDLAPSRQTSNTSNTGVTLILREPAWPVLNLQYFRTRSENGLAGASSHTNATDSRLAAVYDLAPLHLRFDESRQSADSAGRDQFVSQIRRFAVNLDTALFPKLALSGGVQLARSETSLAGASLTGNDNRLGQIRLSSEVTAKVALDALLYFQQTNFLASLSTSDLSARGSAVTLRSEVLPGLQWNVSTSSNRSELAGRITDTSSTYTDLLAQLDPRNSFSLTLSPSRASVSGAPPVDQKAYRASWTSQLTPQTDLLLSLDRFSNASPDFSSRTFTRYVTLRCRPDLQTTLGLSLLLDSLLSSSPGSATSQQIHAIDSDVSWVPNRDLTLGLHLSLQRVAGESATRVKVPGLDLRWQPDAASTLTVSWRLQDQTQRDLEAISLLRFTSFSSQFSRRLSRGSLLTARYDVVNYSEGPIAYERRLGISITTGLGG